MRRRSAIGTCVVCAAIVSAPAVADPTSDLVRIERELAHVMTLVDEVRERTPAPSPEDRLRFRFDRLQQELQALRTAIDRHIELVAELPQTERFDVE